MKIKTGDLVKVTVGKDKGKQGKVTQAFPRLGMIVVDGVRSTVKHLSPRRARGGKNGEKPQGQKVTFNAPIRVENVVLVNEKKG